MTRQEKIERYIDYIIDRMDYKTMYLYVYESIDEDLKDSTEEQIDNLYNEYFKEKWWHINKP